MWTSRVRVSRERLDPKFISLFLNSPTGCKQVLEKAKTTTGLYTVSTSKVASLAVPRPPLTEQCRIVNQASSQTTAALVWQRSPTERRPPSCAKRRDPDCAG
jgi:hypothetical protein